MCRTQMQQQKIKYKSRKVLAMADTLRGIDSFHFVTSQLIINWLQKLITATDETAKPIALTFQHKIYQMLHKKVRGSPEGRDKSHDF